MTTHPGSINTALDCCTARSASGRWTTRIREILIVWSARAQQRHELREVLHMPDHLLRDMGITREEVSREYHKPFWRA